MAINTHYNHPELAPSLLVALTVGVGVSISLFHSSFAAADFSKAKQSYVPPSKIERRCDFEALREYEALVDDKVQTPKSHVLKHSIAHSTNKHHQKSTKRTALTQTLKLNSAELVIKQAMLFENQGMPYVALQMVFQAFAYYPNNLNLLIYEGHLYQKIGQPFYAQLAYIAALEIDPGNRFATMSLENLYKLPITTYSTYIITPTASLSTDGDVAQLSNLLMLTRSTAFAEKHRVQELEEGIKTSPWY